MIFNEVRGYYKKMPEVLELCGQVAVNRVNSPDFPNSLYGVLTQKGQYDSTNKFFNGSWRNHSEFKTCGQACITAAQRVISGQSINPETHKPWPNNVVFEHSYSTYPKFGQAFKQYKLNGYTSNFEFSYRGDDGKSCSGLKSSNTHYNHIAIYIGGGYVFQTNQSYGSSHTVKITDREVSTASCILRIPGVENCPPMKEE